MVKLNLLFFVLFLFSCSNQSVWIIPEDIKTEQDANIVMKTIAYDYEKVDDWWEPQKTYELKTGDCDRTAALLAHIFIYKLHYTDVKMIGCINKSSNIPHMLVYHDGKYYEGRTGEQTTSNYKIIFEFKYTTYIFLARIK